METAGMILGIALGFLEEQGTAIPSLTAELQGHSANSPLQYSLILMDQ